MTGKSMKPGPRGKVNLTLQKGSMRAAAAEQARKSVSQFHTSPPIKSAKTPVR